MAVKGSKAAHDAIAAAAAAIGKQLEEQALAAAAAAGGAVGGQATLEQTIAALAGAAMQVKVAKEAKAKQAAHDEYLKAVKSFSAAAQKVLGKSAPGYAQAGIAFNEFTKVVNLLALVAKHAPSPKMLGEVLAAAKVVGELAALPAGSGQLEAVAGVAAKLVQMSDAELSAQFEDDEMPEAVAHAIDEAQMAPDKAVAAASPPKGDALEEAIAKLDADVAAGSGSAIEKLDAEITDTKDILKALGIDEAIDMLLPNALGKKGAPSKSGMPQVKAGAIADLARAARTQKRAGIEALPLLDTAGVSLLGGAVAPLGVLAVMSPRRGSFEDNVAWLKQCKVEPNPFLRLFFRPCPVKPRHGFVDSRVCESWDQARELYQEALKADAEAEVLVMPELEAQSSAVATSTMVAVGPGNDGATAGKQSVVYDLRSPLIDSTLRATARIGPSEDGYVEAVYDGSVTSIVQLRGGPVQAPSASRIVPTPVPAVRYVEKAEGDLLAWEQTMAKVAAEGRCDKVVVWSPGGSALSHYAVHAVLNKVAISFESKPPQIGDSFLPPDGQADDGGWDAQAFAKGAARAIVEAQSGRMSDKPALALALAFAATGIHSAISLRKGDSAELLGGACATLMMLSSAASCGESRHSTRVVNVANVERERHQVFVQSLANPLGARPLLRLALDSFACDDWGSSYGGRKWAVCAANAVDLEDALFRVVDEAFAEGGKPDVGKVVSLAHRLLNAVHNGGKLLNKFGSSKILDAAASGSIAFSIYAAVRWHALSKGVLACSKQKLMETIVRIRAAGEVESDVMQVWDSASGDFVLGNAPAPTKYVLGNGRAQVRVVDPKIALLKIQYAFDVVQEKPPAEAVKQAVALRRFKNLATGAGSQSWGGAKPGAAGHYTSVTVQSMDLLVAMVEHARKTPGGIEQAPSMASTSTPYVKATKAEPLGLDAKAGVRVFFGEVGVEVKP